MKKIRLKYNRIILLFIFIYIVSNVVILLGKTTTKTLTLKNEMVEESFNKKGLIIRDEYVINSNFDGKVEYYLKDGDRVKKKEDIACVYSNNISNDDLKNLKNIKNDISSIENGDTAFIKKDIENINKEISLLSQKLQIELLNENIDVYGQIEKINKLIDDKNLLINSDLNDKSLKNKQVQEKEVTNLIDKNTEVFKSKNSGVVSYQFDGNEEKFNFDNLNQIKIKDIEGTKNNYKDISKEKKLDKGEPIARIINNLKQFVAISCNEEEIKKIKIGQKIILSSDIEKINSKVYDIYKEGKQYIVILEISEQNVEIYDTRIKEFDIIYKSIEGLKVPKTAVVNLDGKKGVYIVSETGDAKFVELKGTLYESEEYIVIDHYKNDINGVNTIKIYDEIILNPKLKKGFIKAGD
ncbi:HlyD family efflux transporter periplasmic adaptor subunit [Paraclostridium sordellii]|uniref:Efflux transporter, RND family, MFP subunit n=1 Tax=Paraclostridium sordellii TaxID=1505 RepID=A0ABM9RRZ3_PARSO|nr:HlyD family efflux transporter periplasmic adaptor subunit [Paeniclostridium sordellii]EPZ57075.1 hlyD secretion family protein [[Clostridium] sordellii VPI 9048] [Paeniclostridium sordellii VPI 9048]CEJ74839.1 efflux transporter, RND family, MFP subunit [[Clostridium] sordellii] [Paeniclostridium sordellii]CEK39287.1 efflux transporter, RND family, MFP subunit [[Clostridium] sordellii] [Paeniclostridium sordellii]CEN70412.1 secretion protein [[Clostridium] sordellii] [Paeniclostridium sorde